MQIISHPRHVVNITSTERIISALGGGFLAVTGLTQRSPKGIFLAMIGGDLVRRAFTGHCFLYEAFGIRTAPLGQGAETTSVPYELGVRVDHAIIVDRPRAEVFRFWRNLSNLPRFMKHLNSVSEHGKRSHWEVRGPGGRSVQWDALLHNVVENEVIAWRTMPGSDVDHAGSVLFRDASGGYGTEVRVELQYNPPGGAVAAVLSTLWGREPGQQIQEALERFRRILEGRTSEAKAGEARSKMDEVEMASDASFPASDAPAFHP